MIIRIMELIDKVKTSKFVKNISYVFVGKVIAAVCSFGFDIFLARYFDIEGYAELVYYFTILKILFYFGWFGVNASLRIHISKCANIYERKRCTYGGLLIRFAYSTIASMVVFIVMPFFSYRLGYPEKYPNLFGLFKWASGIMFFNSLSEFFKEWCIGLEKYRGTSFITGIEYFGYLIYTIIFVFIDKGIYAPAYGYLWAEITTVIVGMWLMRQTISLKDDKLKVKYMFEYGKKIFLYAVPMAVVSFSGLMLVEMDLFMLGILGNKGDVAVYNVAKNFYTKLTQFNYAIATGTLTTFSVIPHDRYDELKRKFVGIEKFNILVSILMGGGVFAFSRWIVVAMYGENYLEAAYLLRLLAPYYLLNAVSIVYSVFLDFQGRARKHSFSLMSVVAINLVLNYCWIPIWGAKGVALATDLSFLPYTIFVFWCTRKEWKLIKLKDRI